MTAIEWLEDCLTEQYPNSSFVWNTRADLEALFKQAKEMEKQQQGYSEEEVLVLLHKRDAYNFKTNAQSLLDWETPKEWLAQFKKKDHQNKYNEIEVIELLQKALTHQDDGEIGNLVTAQGEIRTANFYSWFEQFKNK